VTADRLVVEVVEVARGVVEDLPEDRGNLVLLVEPDTTRWAKAAAIAFLTTWSLP
jgi:hypothetical protein